MSEAKVSILLKRNQKDEDPLAKRGRTGWNGTDTKGVPGKIMGGGWVAKDKSIKKVNIYSEEESPAGAEESDEGLVRLCLLGDQGAYEELVGRYSKLLYNYIVRLIGAVEEARDALQEVFIKAFQNLYRFNSQNKFKSWLYRIAHNHCVDILRRRKAFLSLDSPVDNDGGIYEVQLADSHPDPERDVSSREMGNLVERAIMELPENYREAIILRHLQELSYEEIAVALGMPLGTVKTNIFRGRELLRERLLSWGIF